MLFPAFPAHAVNRDMVQLQTQVQQLQDAVARLQQSNDERMGVLKDLVQQTADAVNKMTLNMDALQKRVSAQSDASTQKVDQVSVQVQTLADSVDELKARLGRMEKLLQDVQSQQQNMNARMDGAAATSMRLVARPAMEANPTGPVRAVIGMVLVNVSAEASKAAPVQTAAVQAAPVRTAAAGRR